MIFLSFAVIRGWIERKKFSRVLERKARQDDYVCSFLDGVESAFHTYAMMLNAEHQHDLDRHHSNGGGRVGDRDRQRELEEEEALLIRRLQVTGRSV